MPRTTGRPSLGEKANTQLRVEVSLFAKLKHVAKSEGRSANAQIERFIREGVERFESEHGVIDTDTEE